VSGGDRGDGRRERGHGRGDVHVRSRRRLAHRPVAVVTEPVHRSGARRRRRPARGERGEEAAAEAGGGGARRAEEVNHLGSRRRETEKRKTMAAWRMISPWTREKLAQPQHVFLWAGPI
jgi:hypothetical protein